MIQSRKEKYKGDVSNEKVFGDFGKLVYAFVILAGTGGGIQKR